LVDDSELLVTGKNGVVASDVDVCSQIGVDTMKKGGNAVDAAIGMLSALVRGKWPVLTICDSDGGVHWHS
jgi:hypothetical protein